MVLNAESVSVFHVPRYMVLNMHVYLICGLVGSYADHVVIALIT